MSRFPGQFGAGNAYGEDARLQYESAADSITVAQFFNMVYAWMCVGLALSAVVGWYVSQNATLLNTIYGSRGGYAFIALAAFGLAWYAQSQAGRISSGVATALFLVYATVIGALLAGIFKIYPAKTLAASFIVTGGVFGAMSVYGFVTKRDLSRMGSIFIMLALGFMAASFVNLWLASNTLSWIITYAVLVLFVGITAYQTQHLRELAVQYGGNREMATRFAIFGSLVLYIAFINLFISILRIMGDRR